MTAFAGEPWWSVALAAAFAPLIVWCLWRVQAVAVDQVLRRALYRLLRNHTPLYNVVSWTGVLLHETAHAVMLLLGGHGVRRFKVGVDAGHVTPRQVRRGPLGLWTFVAAALAPIYAAPAAILLLFAFAVRPGILEVHAAGPGLAAAWDALGGLATTFAQDLLLGFLALDVLTWGGAAVLALAVFALPAARPSHVKGEGGKKEGDIAVVREKLRRHPLSLVTFLLLLYALYFLLVPFLPVVYWAFFQALWAVAITGILLSSLGGVAWWLVARSGRITPLLQPVPWILALAAQAVPRATGLPGDWGALWMNVASALLFGAATLLLAAAAPRRRI